jgi:DNA-binding CsgD family transcriptional regulator
MPDPVTGPLVGRTDQLAQLDAAMVAAGSGRPAVILIEGEAGVGKTRLMTEWLERARMSGAMPALGVCVALHEGLLPYGPIAQVLRALGRGLGRARLRLLAADAPPELAALLPADCRPDREPVGPAPPGRLFESLLDMLDAASAEQPLAICLDDIHSADPATADFLRYLARSLTGERLAVALTYRPLDMAGRTWSQRLHGELIRTARGCRLTVVPFTPVEVAARLTDLLGRSPPAELADRLYRRSGGNAYFLEELVAAGVDEAATPPSLRALLWERLRAVSSDAAEVLRLVAVAGGASEHAQLVAAGLLSPEALDAALTEAVDHDLLRREGAGWVRLVIRHPLLQEVVDEAILPAHRRALHLCWARALDACGEPDPAARARHWDAAGEAAPALVDRVAAAEQAASVGGYEQAARHWRRALRLWREVDKPVELVGFDEAELRVRAADALRRAGVPDEAIPLLERAIAHLTGHPARAAAALDLLSGCLRETGCGDQARQVAERAAALLVDAPASPHTAQAATGLAYVKLARSQYRAATEQARRALAIAETAGARLDAARARNALGVALVLTGEVKTGLEELARGRAEVKVHGAIMDRLSAANSEVYGQLHCGQYRDGVVTALASHDLARRHGLTLTAVARGLLGNAATALVWLGEYDRADRLAASALAGDCPDGLSAFVHVARAEGAVATGRWVDADRHLSLARRTATDLDEPMLLGHLAACQVERLLWAGRPADAAREAVRALAVAGAGEDDQILLRLSALGARALADVAETAALGRTRTPEGSEFTTRARQLAANLSADLPEGHAYAQLVRAEAMRAEGYATGAPADPLRWLDAMAAFTALSRPYAWAYCAWRAAEALLATKARRKAAALLTEAYPVARSIGAGPLAEELGAFARRARLVLPSTGSAMDPTSIVDPTERATEPDGTGLTAREHEVLAMVCEGRTNRQIGRVLFMSEKTASVHVSRILAKLNVRSRTAAAAAARRLGMHT